MADTPDKQRKRLEQVLQAEQARFAMLTRQIFTDKNAPNKLIKQVNHRSAETIANELEWCPEEHGKLSDHKNTPDRIAAAANSAREIAKADKQLQQLKQLKREPVREKSDDEKRKAIAAIEERRRNQRQRERGERGR